LLDYDVSLHKVIELFVSFKMSPRSSKMESGCSCYCLFCFGVFASFGGPEKAGLGAEKADPWHIRVFYLPVGGGGFLAGFLAGKSRSGPEKAGLRPEKAGLSCPNGHIFGGGVLIRPKRIYFPEHVCYYFSSNLCVLNTTNTD
jgi:hypothetical protein